MSLSWKKKSWICLLLWELGGHLGLLSVLCQRNGLRVTLQCFSWTSCQNQLCQLIWCTIPQTQQENYSWWTSKWYIKSQGSVWLWQLEFDCNNICSSHWVTMYNGGILRLARGWADRQGWTTSYQQEKKFSKTCLTSQKLAKIWLTQQETLSNPSNPNKNYFDFVMFPSINNLITHAVTFTQHREHCQCENCELGNTDDMMHWRYS